MTDHPTTYKGESNPENGIEWDDRAFLHHVDDGGGVLDSAKSIRDGTFADLIRHIMLMPELSRAEYYIQKAGDRRFDYPEIATLYNSKDFPHGN